MTLGEKLRLLRKRRGWSQEELAWRLDVSRQTLSKWELGTAVPDTGNLRKVSALFGVSADALLDEESDLEATPWEKAAQTAAVGTGLSERAKRLVDEKGYRAGYILAAGCVPGLMVCVFICWAYLSVLARLAPLSEFPLPAFIVPAAAGILAVLTAVRMVLYLLLARRLRHLKD